MKDTADNIPRVFLDTNILMDYVLFRTDEALAIEHIFDSSMDLRLSLHIAAHSLTNLYTYSKLTYSESMRIM